MIFYIAEIMTKHLWYVTYTSSKVFLLQFSLALPRYQGPTDHTMMKLAVFTLFCLETSLAGPPSKAQLEDWEVRSDLQS